MTSNRRSYAVLGLALALAATGACRRRQAASPQATHAAEEEGPAIPGLTVDEVSSRITRGEPLRVYDVNRRDRYEQGHVPGATWVTVRSVPAEVLPQDRSTPLVFYCSNEH